MHILMLALSLVLIKKKKEKKQKKELISQPKEADRIPMLATLLN